MKHVINFNTTWWWGTSTTFIYNDGKGMVELLIESDEKRNYFGTISSLQVHESVRRQGRGRALLEMAEKKAKEMGLEQVVLFVAKGSWLVNWYQRQGYEIYDENPEYSHGLTVGMNKYLK